MIGLALAAIAVAALTVLLEILAVDWVTDGRWLEVAPAVIVGATLGALAWVALVIMIGRWLADG